MISLHIKTRLFTMECYDDYEETMAKRDQFIFMSEKVLQKYEAFGVKDINDASKNIRKILTKLKECKNIDIVNDSEMIWDVTRQVTEFSQMAHRTVNSHYDEITKPKKSKRCERRCETFLKNVDVCLGGLPLTMETMVQPYYK